jgi:hypothetical protein
LALQAWGGGALRLANGPAARTLSSSGTCSTHMPSSTGSHSVAIATTGTTHRANGAPLAGGPPVLVTFGALCLALRCLIIVQRWSGYEIGKYFFADDAFYYLKIAQNVARGHGSTFDGMVSTNGYHPLWELCCIALHAVWPGTEAGMVGLIYAIQTGLLLMAAWLLYLGLRAWNPWAAALSALLLMLNTVTSLVLVNGMESGLTFTLLCAFTYLAATRGERFFDVRDARYSLALAALLSSLALARLEAAIFPGTFVLIALVRGLREGGHQLRHSLAIAAAISGVAALYVVSNLAIVGLPLPVSGLVKALWPEAPHELLHLLGAQLGWFVSPLRLQQVFENRWISSILFVALVWGLCVFVRDAWRRRQHGLVLLVGDCAILIAYNLFATRQSFQWYGWPALLLGTLGSFGLLARLLSGLTVWRARAAFTGIMLIALAYGAGTTYRLATRDYNRLFDWSSSPVLMDEAMQFIQHEIPADARLAGDSVGLLAYLSGREIANVEGLVADRAYYDALKRGQSRALLSQRGVTWLITTRLDAYAPPCAQVQRWDLGERARDSGVEPVIGGVRIYQLDYAACDRQP